MRGIATVAASQQTLLAIWMLLAALEAFIVSREDAARQARLGGGRLREKTNPSLSVGTRTLTLRALHERQPFLERLPWRLRVFELVDV